MSAKALSAAALALALAFTAPPAPARAQFPTPSYTYDIDFLKVPPQYVMGDVSAVAVDRRDHVWVLHRPRTVAAEQRSRAAPAVMEFDSAGRFIQAWGGPAAGYDWPSNEHSLFVDGKDRVWIGGNARAVGDGDDMILAFTNRGTFIRQIGGRGTSKGDADTANLNAPADLFVDTGRNEIYAADGYGNRRVIVFDTETGAFKRMWGAFGAPPPTTPLGPAPPVLKPEGAPNQTGDGSREFRSVHGVELAVDDLLYVSDRDSQRVQVFDRMGDYKTQVFIHRDYPNRQTASGLALSSDGPQRWLYVVDFGNAQIVILDRRTLTPVAEIGVQGAGPGEFIGPHLMAMDSKGVLYVAEVQGRRLQRLVPVRTR
jgi:DNA-binding beta-propeller fold protein YncE